MTKKKIGIKTQNRGRFTNKQKILVKSRNRNMKKFLIAV